MSKLATKIQSENFFDFSGGLNEAVTAEAINRNESPEMQDMEILVNKARSRRGYDKENSTPLYAISTSYELGTESRTVGNAVNELWAQGFQLAAIGTVARVAVRMKKFTAPTGNISCAIYTDNAGDPNVAVTGADFTDFNTKDISTLDTSYQWVWFTLTTGVSLAATTQYHLVIKYDDGDAGNYLQIEHDLAGASYASGIEKYSDDAGVTWASVAADADGNFRVYAGLATITGIMDYRLSDGSAAWHLVCADGEIYKNVAGTMTPITQRYRTALTSGANYHWSWCIGNDTLFLTNGQDVAKKFYRSSSVDYFENDGIATPTTLPVYAAAAGGALADGTWYVDYCYYNSRLATRSNFKHGLLASTDNDVVLGTGNNTIDITGLPSDVERYGDGVTHILIYLKSPTGSAFQYAGDTDGKIAIGTTTASIDADALGADGEDDNNVSATHSIEAFGDERRVISGNTTYPNYVYISKVGTTGSLPESFPSTNFRRITQNEGDKVTAVIYFPPDMWVIGLEDRIYSFSSKNPLTSQLYLISKEIGIVGKHAWINADGILFFHSKKGVYGFDGNQIFQAKTYNVSKTFKSGINTARYPYFYCENYFTGDQRFQWWTLFSSTSSSTHDQVAVYDYALQAWMCPWNISGNCLGIVEDLATKFKKLYLGGTGYEYELDTGTSDDGAQIDAWIKTKLHSGIDAAKRKIWRKLICATTQISGGSLDAIFYVDGTKQIISHSFDLDEGIGSGTVWDAAGSAWWGMPDAKWGSISGKIVDSVSIRGNGNFLQIRFGKKDNAWELNYYGLEYQPSERH